MLPIRRTLVATALCLVAGAVQSSCIYSDLGRTVGSIGAEVPRMMPQAANGEKSYYLGQLYRKGEHYYVALPVVWVPERRKGYEFFPLYSAGDVFNDNCTYNRPYSAAELLQYPATQVYFEAVEPVIVRFPQPDPHGAVGYLCSELKPAPDFTPEGAQSLGAYGVDGAAHRIVHLGKRHAWYHYPLVPVQTAATVADVALSAVLMPTSFIFFAVYECSSWKTMESMEFAQPWYDDSRISFGSRRPEYDTGISPPESMVGKRLILGSRRYEFRRKNFVKYTGNGQSCHHCYSAGDSFPFAIFSEARGDAANRWLLLFSTPTSGVAIDDSLRREKQPSTPQSQPFRIEAL